MKRGIVNTFIAGYLGVLLYGLFCHALYYKINQHPAMYFIIWDMYCGWAGYETRLHVVGEGESGQFYELAPGPWGSITPHGVLDRRHYDHTGLHSVRLGLNTLRHTKHEPIARLFVVEEAWPRKFNLPDELWARRYTEPKDPVSYFQIRSTYTGDGRLTQSGPSWLARIAQDCIMDNPRLLADMKKGRPFYAVEPGVRRGHVTPAAYEMPVD
jgi:hypothetical protein